MHQSQFPCGEILSHPSLLDVGMLLFGVSQGLRVSGKISEKSVVLLVGSQNSVDEMIMHMNFTLTETPYNRFICNPLSTCLFVCAVRRCSHFHANNGYHFNY